MTLKSLPEHLHMLTRKSPSTSTTTTIDKILFRFPREVDSTFSSGHHHQEEEDRNWLYNSLNLPELIQSQFTSSNLINDIEEVENETSAIITGNNAHDFESHNNMHSKGAFNPLSKFVNYFQAIFTLFLCFLILASLLCLIKKTKLWCINRKRRSNYQTQESFLLKTPEESAGFSSENGDAGTCIENINENEDDVKKIQKPTDSIQVVSDKEKDKSPRDKVHPPPLLKQNSLKPPPKIHFERRASGPFNDEALEFAEELYHKRNRHSVKNRPPPGHHPQHHHHHQHPHLSLRKTPSPSTSFKEEDEKEKIKESKSSDDSGPSSPTASSFAQIQLQSVPMKEVKL